MGLFVNTLFIRWIIYIDLTLMASISKKQWINLYVVTFLNICLGLFLLLIQRVFTKFN